MINIAIASYSPGAGLIKLIDSITRTVKSDYELRIVHTKGSAAQNKNLCLNGFSSDGPIILLDDDVWFEDEGWAEKLIMSHAITSADIVGARIKFDGDDDYVHHTNEAEDSAVVSNVRIPGCAMLVGSHVPHYDEKYIKSQCDDIDLMLNVQKQGGVVAVDTRVTVHHPKVRCVLSDFRTANRIYAESKWGGLFGRWGKDVGEFKVIHRY